MLKKYIRTIFATLAAMGAIFFVGSAYSNGNGVVAGQPQLDLPATAGTTVSAAAATTSVSSNAGSAGATKETPTSGNGQAVEREVFKGEVVTNK